MNEADGPTEDDVVGTCDWGGCNGDTVALRRDLRDGRWLSVCTRHRTKTSVAVELVMAADESRNPTEDLWAKRNTPSGAFEVIKRSGDVFKGVRREN